MTDQAWSAARVADVLLRAEEAATAQTSIAADWDGLDLATAYTAQDIALRMRLARGERLTGVKLGVTSKAKQRQVGVDAPSTAWLTDAMILPIGAPVPRARLIQARAEPEIAFVMGRRLAGPGVSAATALAAVDHVLGAVEIIDSRFSGYRFSMMDAVADNNSSGRYVTGPIARRPEDLDLALEACLLEVDGEVVDSATGAAVHGHPAEALAFAANTLAERGLAIEPGWVVLTGGMTDAVPVAPGARIAAHFTHLGSVTVAGG
ncbi:fumarylacetoacetate hydrolase family protein [Nocardia farcinica]|uniref:2-hydroxypent-2,4-dienoate hydratase n=1 Tax=Nocardia farcinica TaxID=37329 RepID=A0A0H5NG28_NOCFR|nr:fumarylacetoacetate hydrolase family protein [Nocardia farcinica]AXK84518.1 4-oxalocrotonate decarboxylase [Nocardia farcinica]MBF6260504.1 fumarylacetoacetate hydrolase family protein [Nocardia farcinica]MBF6279826.1 fumarylacetoacetate hydrolase family protein [Nocardia farcinica]MBF6303514.1 fumarylacetoacetate hydrolase family protein [Nocardia farcinica]MBF6358745.1 fumarylacetoacetate hydrolase family protein [Nocardia farcinica]